MSERPRADAAPAPAPVVPTLTFTEKYRAALKNTRAGGIAVETERLLIGACIPYSTDDPAFTTASAFHLNVGRFVFAGTLGGDPRWAPGRKSARFVVSDENVCPDDPALSCRTRVYSTATLKFVVGKRGRPNKVLVKISGTRANFQDVVGSPELDFSVVAPAIWTSDLTALEGGASAAPRELASGFSVESVVSLGTLSNTFDVAYAGTSKPKVKTLREVVDYDPDTLQPIYGRETHFLADMSIVGTGTLK
jgi:hypothetical protein